jgi:hypothetical protein
LGAGKLFEEPVVKSVTTHVAHQFRRTTMNATKLVRATMIAGAVTLVAVPMGASAAEPTQWLQRQFSTTHEEAAARDGMKGRAGEVMGEPAAQGDGRAYAEGWLKRQFSTTHVDERALAGVRGRAGDLLDAAPVGGHEFSMRWLQRQFSADHRLIEI